MDTITRDLPYGELPRQTGDLFLPGNGQEPRLPVLLIHGGGWNALSKESIEPIARVALRFGHPVFSINYRLLKHAPWPACGNDCRAAGHFLLADMLKPHGLPAPDRIIFAGASAGGHLAMMTGLRLPADRIAGILSLAGPSRLYPRDDTGDSAIRGEGFLEQFFGRPTNINDDRVAAASPVHCVGRIPPPLTCIHSVNDHLVPLSHSQDAVTAWNRAGGSAQLHTYDGPGHQHGFWTSDDIATRSLIPEVLHHLEQYFKLTPAS
ncbi:MAG: alpha/beta hydrolase [Verrucomicrobiota bacterium JB024]|nr:alpha/beta hydrolase [Verrucomicrobiota bacterium JB024]